MSGTCSEPRSARVPRRPEARGVTMVELIMVMVLVGVLAAFAVPKLTAAVSMRNDSWHDEVQAALRYAQKTAVSHRRLVCASVSSTSVDLTIAAANPASACGVVLIGSRGNAAFATSDGATAVVLSPAGPLYFQPDGRITTDGAGSASSNWAITVSGAGSITVVGETGHVD